MNASHLIRLPVAVLASISEATGIFDANATSKAEAAAVLAENLTAEQLAALDGLRPIVRGEKVDRDAVVAAAIAELERVTEASDAAPTPLEKAVAKTLAKPARRSRRGAKGRTLADDLLESLETFAKAKPKAATKAKAAKPREAAGDAGGASLILEKPAPAVLRWMGREGFSPKEAAAVLEASGVSYSYGTTTNHLSRGKRNAARLAAGKNEPIPNLSATERKELARLAGRA